MAKDGQEWLDHVRLVPKHQGTMIAPQLKCSKHMGGAKVEAHPHAGIAAVCCIHSINK